MKLIDLVKQCADFRNIFEINQQNNDWDTYDTLWDDSPLLKPYLEILSFSAFLKKAAQGPELVDRDISG